MRLIFMYGLPATGKLTVGKELAAISGYKLFHNHLAVDLLLSVFEFGSPHFIELRETIWLSVFASAAQANLPGLVFTFAPETTVRPQFLTNAIKTVENYGGEVDFVQLICPISELKQRLENESRKQYQKLASVDLFEQLHEAGIFATGPMPKPAITIDTAQCTPAEAASRIARELNLAAIPTE